MLDASTAPETLAVAPRAAPANPRACPNCGEEFVIPSKGPGGHKRFCSDPCRVAWGNREKAHGAVVITLAKIWRKNRGSGEIGKAAFARLTEALDILISEDEASGRPKLLAGGKVDRFLKQVVDERYLDRKRR
jgi:hypothetical protein